jgi:hypothetical protein
MHGADSVESNLPGNFCETSGDGKLAHEFFAVVEVLEVHFELVEEELFVGRECYTS